MPETDNIEEIEMKEADCGSDDDDDVVETQRFSNKKLKRLDERKYRLTNKSSKFQLLVQAKQKVNFLL